MLVSRQSSDGPNGLFSGRDQNTSSLTPGNQNSYDGSHKRGASASRVSEIREIRLSNEQLEQFLAKMGRSAEALAFVELIRHYSLDNPLEYLEELRTHPNSAKSPIACLLLSTRLEDPADKLAWAKKFAEIEPDNLLSKLTLAKALGEMGQSAEALELLRNAVGAQSISHEEEFVRNFNALKGILPEEDINLLVFQSGNRWHNQIDTELYGGMFGSVDFWSTSEEDPTGAIELFSSSYSYYMNHRSEAGKFGTIRGTGGYAKIMQVLKKAPKEIAQNEAFSNLRQKIVSEVNDQVTYAISQNADNLGKSSSEIEEASLKYRHLIK